MILKLLKHNKFMKKIGKQQGLSLGWCNYFPFMLRMPERALTQEVEIEFSKGSWKNN